MRTCPSPTDLANFLAQNVSKLVFITVQSIGVASSLSGFQGVAGILSPLYMLSPVDLTAGGSSTGICTVTDKSFQTRHYLNLVYRCLSTTSMPSLVRYDRILDVESFTNIELEFLVTQMGNSRNIGVGSSPVVV